MTKVISVKEARKVLGKASESLDDNQIDSLIDSLSFIANEALKMASSGELSKSPRQDHSNPEISVRTGDHNE